MTNETTEKAVLTRRNKTRDRRNKQMTRMGWKKIEEPYLHGYELYVSSAAQVQVIRHFPCDWRCYLIVDGCAYKEGAEEAGKSFLNRKCCELYAMNKYHDFIYDQHKDGLK